MDFPERRRVRPHKIGARVGVLGGSTANRYRYDYIERNLTGW
ncbi:hypothetical protein [Micromonospora sp. NPDC001898]